MSKIRIFSTPVCPYCHMLKDYLKENKIEYTDINVAADDVAAEEMVAKSGQMGVPVSIITLDDGQEEVVVGFDKARIKELLHIA